MLLTNAIKKNWEENKKTYITAGVLIGVGMVVGMKYQKKLDVKNLAKNIKKGKALIPNMAELTEPRISALSLAEIKEAVLTIKGATIQEALVTTVDGLPMLFVR